MDSSPSSQQARKPESILRMWKPAAQRNIRNQWSKLAALSKKWESVSTMGKSHAVSIVNNFLSFKYVPSMEFGALSDMPLLREKARSKFLKQLEDHRNRLLSSYKALIKIVVEMMETTSSLRCYIKSGGTSSLVTFVNSKELEDDDGDGGRIPVYTLRSVLEHEELAKEVAEMFASELIMKRLIVVELLTLGCEVNETTWLDELYLNEFDDLEKCNVLYEVQMRGALKFEAEPERETLQVFLTAWLAEVNVDRCRLDFIFSVIEDEISANFRIK